MIRLVLLMIAAAALLGGLPLLQGGQPAASAPVQVGASTSARDERVSVVLAPRRQAVLSAEVAGRVVKVHKEFGQAFAAGEALVELDDLTYRVNRQLAEAELAAAEGTLTEVQRLSAARTRERHAEAVLGAAQANLAATQRLFNDGHASAVDLENARRDALTAQTDLELVQATAARELLVAQREVEQARGRLEIASDQLRACRLTGPYAGRVARVLVAEQEWVERGRPVIEVVDDRVLLAKFLLPSALFLPLIHI